MLAALTALLVVGCQLPPLSPDLEHRPLHLPTLPPGAVCPATRPTQRFVILADGQTTHRQYVGVDTVTGEWPVYVEGDSHLVFPGGPRELPQPVVAEQLWLIDPTYPGPALERGRRLDSSGTVLFDSQPGEQPMAELHLMGGKALFPVWTVWPTYSQTITEGGCHGFQVDGDFFSYVIVFYVTWIP